VQEIARAYPRERGAVVSLGSDVQLQQLLDLLVALEGGPERPFAAVGWMADGTRPDEGDDGDQWLRRRLALRWDDPEVTLLGDAQWAWLEEQLRVPAEVRLIASSGQVVADEKGMDEWGNYPLERERLFDLVEKTKAAGVVFLSGNVHFAELSKTDEGPYPLYDFTSSGLTHVNEEYPKAPNRHRVAGPFVEVNFGVVEIDWEARPSASISLSALDVEGRPAFREPVSLDVLRPAK
jgi:hypothetical protein